MANVEETVTIYNAVLLRDPTDAELAAFVAASQTAEGEANAIEGLATSEEAVDDVYPFVRIYQAVFGRVPDAAGLEFWVDAMRDGLTLQTIVEGNADGTIAGFKNSAEFVAEYGEDVDPTSDTFITALYQNLLGREPDAEGLEFFTSLPDTATVGDVVAAFTQSPEFGGQINAQIEIFLERAGAGTQDYEGTVYDVNDDGVVDETDQDIVDGTFSPLAASLETLESAQEAKVDFLASLDLDDNPATDTTEADVASNLATAEANLAADVTADGGDSVLQANLAAAQADVDTVSGLDAAIEDVLAEEEAYEAAIEAAGTAAVEADAEAAAFDIRNADVSTLAVDLTAPGGVVATADLGAGVVDFITVNAGGELEAATGVDTSGYEGFDALLADLQAAYDASLSEADAQAEFEAAVTAVLELEGVDTTDPLYDVTTYYAEASGDVTFTAAFGTDAPNTSALLAAQADIEERNELKADVAEAEELADQLADLSADITVAVDAVADLGYEEPVALADTDVAAGTEDSDIFVLADADADAAATINDFSAEGDDLLFVGEGYSLVNLEAGADLDVDDTAGDAAALEVFVQQQGDDTLLWIESQAFVGNDTTGNFDGNTITLADVDASQVQIDVNGFISIADSETVA